MTPVARRAGGAAVEEDGLKGTVDEALSLFSFFLTPGKEVTTKADVEKAPSAGKRLAYLCYCVMSGEEAGQADERGRLLPRDRDRDRERLFPPEVEGIMNTPARLISVMLVSGFRPKKKQVKAPDRISTSTR